MKETLVKLRNGKANNIQVITYPDGQHNVKIKLDEFNVKHPVIIHCSIKNFEELEILLCIIWAFRQHDFFIAEIHFMYLFGLRSDRAFDPGMPNYLKDVLGPIIKDLNIPNISFLCPHNKNAINNFLGICNPHIIYTNESVNGQEIFTHLQPLCEKVVSFVELFKKAIFIGGDESSGITFQDGELYNPVNLSFKKIRDKEIIKIHLDEYTIDIINNYSLNTPIVIVDDLCDAGGTFIAEAKYLKELFPLKNLYLFVAHGLFTKGVDIVAEHFDMIFTTNSYQDINHPKVYQYRVI